MALCSSLLLRASESGVFQFQFSLATRYLDMRHEVGGPILQSLCHHPGPSTTYGRYTGDVRATYPNPTDMLKPHPHAYKRIGRLDNHAAYFSSSIAIAPTRDRPILLGSHKGGFKVSNFRETRDKTSTHKPTLNTTHDKEAPRNTHHARYEI